MISALVLPYFSGTLNRSAERREIASIVHAVERLRNDSLSFLETGRISAGDNALLFFLGGQERNRFAFDLPVELDKEIVFNRHGLTRGGRVVVPYSRSRKYVIIVAEPWGQVRLERWLEK